MNIALTHIHAAASARFCGKNAFVRAVVLGCAMACASVTAFAGPDRDRDGPRNPQQQQQVPPSNREQPPPRAERMPPQQPPQQRADPRQSDSHAYDDQRRQAPPQDQGTRRPGRLTPDERRELRRQINEAGIDLYPNTPRR
jgi:hypothetical protein